MRIKKGWSFKDCNLTGVFSISYTIDGTAELLWLNGLVEFAGIRVEALDATVLTVSNAQQRLVLGKSQAVRYV